MDRSRSVRERVRVGGKLKLGEVEARLDEAEPAAEHQHWQQQSAVDVCAIVTKNERVPMIEIDVADVTMTAAAGMFHRAVVAEMAATVVVWWGDSEAKEAVMKDDIVVWYYVVRRLDARVGGVGALVWWRSVEAITLN